MARKRPAPDPVPQESSSSSSFSYSQGHLRAPIFSPALRIHVLEDKLGPGEKSFLESLVLKHGGRTSAHIDEADVVITAVRGAKRLKRSIPKRSVRAEKTFVPVEWLKDSITEESSQPFSSYLLHFDEDGNPRSESPMTETNDSPIVQHTPSPLSISTMDTPRAIKTDARLAVQYSVEELRRRYTSENLACFRWCPLKCINDALVCELAIIKNGRNLLDGNETSALSYSRAIAAIKGYPWEITAKTKVREMKGIGIGVASKIEEWFQTGRMSDADVYRSNNKLIELKQLAEVYGIGAKKAREFHANGITSIDQLPEEYHTDWLHDFAQRIPRIEVEEIAEVVAEHLERIQPGCEYCITGGYRRGKPTSGDIDIVITHRQHGKEKHLLSKLQASLEAAGVLVNTIYKTSTGSERPTGAQNFHTSRMDPLDKLFGVFLPPSIPGKHMQQIHRRVDLIVAAYDYYWTAIIGWSGSTQFERDLRRHAEHKGLKFDSGGLTHRTTSEDYIIKSEEHLFEILGLPYIRKFSYKYLEDALR